jgi:hypothetical protein
MDATIAERLRARDHDPDGTPLLAHIRRVVRATSADAHSVAWLHEALETGRIHERELLAQGLTSDELRALRLLTAIRPCAPAAANGSSARSGG